MNLHDCPCGEHDVTCLQEGHPPAGETPASDPMGIQPSQRATDATRNDVLDWLRDGHIRGAIDADQFSARANVALTAATEMELQALVRDLPERIQKQPSSLQLLAPYIARGVAWSAMVALLAVIPVTLAFLASQGIHNGWGSYASGGQIAEAIGTIVTGILWVIAAIVLGCTLIADVVRETRHTGND